MEAWTTKLLQQHNIPTSESKNQHFSTVILSSNQYVDSFFAILPQIFQKEQDLESIPNEWICGFDAEFEKDKKVATIQISTRSLAGIIQCSLILKEEGKLTPKLFDFLLDSSITKVGKGIFESDVPFLCRTFPQQLESKQKQLQSTCLDLGELFQTVFGIATNLGLKPLGHQMLGIISKKPIKNRSTWASRILTKEMIDYAANDAWLGIELAYLAYDAGCISLQSFAEWTKDEKENICSRKQYKQEHSDGTKEDFVYNAEKKKANRAVASAFSVLSKTGAVQNFAKEKLKETQRISTQIRQNNSNIQDLIQSMKRGRPEDASSNEEVPEPKKQKKDTNRGYKKKKEEDGEFMFNIARK